jgi:hypothetical protein
MNKIMPCLAILTYRCLAEVGAFWTPSLFGFVCHLTFCLQNMEQHQQQAYCHSCTSHIKHVNERYLLPIRKQVTGCEIKVSTTLTIHVLDGIFSALETKNTLLNFVYNHEILIQKNTYNYQNKMP